MKIEEDIIIVVAGEAIVFRPSLRHAIRLEARPGSFAKIMREVAEGSLTAACEIIRAHRPDLSPSDIFEAGLADLTLPLIAYVGRCTGIDPDDVPAERKAKGPTVTLGEHLHDLYRIGTGWLGWTPAQTLDSTPAEIRLAHRGRLDMLKAIFGSGDQSSAPDKDTRPLDEKFRTIFAAHGTVKAEV